MKEKICCILGAGEYFGDEIIPAAAFIIAADAGVNRCRQMGVEPDVIIGDFDSLGHEAAGKNVIKLPVMKDDTDTLAAVRYGLERGYKRFILFGCTGGRLSHTIANLQTLTFIAKRAGIGFLVDKEEVVTATCKGVHFDSDYHGFLSVFAAEGAAVISESGLKYTLDRENIDGAFPIGVSNEFCGVPAAVTVHEGTVWIAVEKKNKGVFTL